MIEELSNKTTATTDGNSNIETENDHVHKKESKYSKNDTEITDL